MKLLLLGLLILAAIPAQSAPYFRVALRPADKGYLYEAVGAFLDPVVAGQSALAKQVAILSHSPRDGCVLPSIVCEDWSPLALGFSINSGRFLFGLGPSVNLTPALKGGLLKLLEASTKEDTALGAKAALSPSQSKLSLSISPSWVVAPCQNWKGYFKIFVGPAWSF